MQQSTSEKKEKGFIKNVPDGTKKIRNRINIKNKTAGHAGIACFSFALKGNRAGSPNFKIVRFKWWEHVTFVILIYWFAYAIMPIGKRNDESMWTKRVKPSVPRILGASFVIRNMC